MWKFCGESYGLNDVYVFDFNPNIFSNTLYSKNIPILKLNKYRHWYFNEEIIVESLDGSKKGRYCGK